MTINWYILVKKFITCVVDNGEQNRINEVRNFISVERGSNRVGLFLSSIVLTSYVFKGRGQLNLCPLFYHACRWHGEESICDLSPVSLTRRRIYVSFITGVANAGNKFRTRVTETRDKFMTVVAGTNNKCMTGVNTSDNPLHTKISQNVQKN